MNEILNYIDIVSIGNETAAIIIQNILIAIATYLIVVIGVLTGVFSANFIFVGFMYIMDSLFYLTYRIVLILSGLLLDLIYLSWVFTMGLLEALYKRLF